MILKLGDILISILFYADDMVLLFDSDEKAPQMLDSFHTWCTKWPISINDAKGGDV